MSLMSMSSHSSRSSMDNSCILPLDFREIKGIKIPRKREMPRSKGSIIGILGQEPQLWICLKLRIQIRCQWKNPPFEDVFPIENGGFFQCSVSFPHISPRIPTDIFQNRQIDAYVFEDFKTSMTAVFARDATMIHSVFHHSGSRSCCLKAFMAKKPSDGTDCWGNMRSFEIWLNGLILKLRNLIFIKHG